jgi:hypothetical protein
MTKLLFLGEKQASGFPMRGGSYAKPIGMVKAGEDAAMR